MTKDEGDDTREEWVIKNVEQDRIVSGVYDSHADATYDADDFNVEYQSNAYQVVQFWPGLILQGVNHG